MRRCFGFTLIEVLIALTLIVMLTGAMGLFVWQLEERRRAVGDLSADLRAGVVLIDALERDLLTCVAAGGDGGGVRGDGESLRVLSRGVELAGLRDGSAMRDLQGREYRASAGGELTVRRWIEGGPTGPGEVISGRVERLRFRYHDGEAWRDSFDSAVVGGLPTAVEVAVWFSPAGVEAVRGEDAVGEAGFGGAEFGEADEDAAGFDGEDGFGEGLGVVRRWGAPDRLRVIAVPDAGHELGRASEL